MVVPDAPRIRGLEHLWETSASDRITCAKGQFGAARDGGRRAHHGVDLDAHFEPVGAALAGRVTFAGRSTSKTGNLVVIDHGHGVKTYYMHLDSIAVRVGDTVDRETRIGISGRTGTKAPHLHYEVRVGGKSVPPNSLINPFDGALAPVSVRRRGGRMMLGANRPDVPSLEAVYRVPVPDPALSRTTRHSRVAASSLEASAPLGTVTTTTSCAQTAATTAGSTLSRFVNWIADWVESVGLASIAVTIRAAAKAITDTPPAASRREIDDGARRNELGASRDVDRRAPLVARSAEAALSRAATTRQPPVGTDRGRSIVDEMSL